jgi:serine protease inhibitor
MSPGNTAGLALVILWGMTLGLVGTAQAQTNPGDPRVGNEKPQTALVVQGSNHFAFDLYARLRADHGNLFFSPTSISTALAMTLAGASGETAAQMAKSLHLELPKDQVDAAMRELLASWKSSDKKQGFQLSVANRLWAQTGQPFLPAYLTVTRTDYGAELARLDFAKDAEQSRQTINQWVEDQTAGKIKDLILSAAQLSGARLVLTNAVHFKGDWTDPFKKNLTKDEDFHVSLEQTVKAPLMHTRHHFRYAASDGLQVLELPYSDRSLSLVVLLPAKKDGLAELEARLTFENWQHWTQALASQDVIVFLPRFKTSTQFELNSMLQSVGITSAFNPQLADFSGMTGNRDFYISAVLHKAYVDVNEEGTEAAAATGIIMRATAVRRPRPEEPPVFRADHPFVFAIRDNRNGAVLFIGRLADPTHS